MSNRTTSESTRKLNLSIIGENIRKHREAQGCTQREMSVEFGAHESYFRGIENGQKELSLHRLIEIADMLGVPAGDLLENV